MKRFFKYIMVVNAIMMCFATSIAFAHSGRTDSSGGHKDNKNKSGLGSYHYHCGGYPAHLHENGVCPYKSSNTGAAENSNTKTNGTSNSSSNTNAPVAQKSVDKINIENAPSDMNLGGETRINLSIESENSEANVKWSSSDDSIVSVDSDGNLNALKEGTATITISTDNNSKSFDVKVSKIEVEWIVLSDNKIDIQIGETSTLLASIMPVNASNKTLLWATENKDIVTVDQAGNIKGISAGTTKVNVTADNGVTESITINVSEVFPEDIEINIDYIKMNLKDTHSIFGNIIPGNATNKKLTFVSDDESIAKVDEEGNVTALKEGKATITVTTSNNISKTISIEVYSKSKKRLKVSGISLVGLSGVFMARKKYFKK